MDNLIRENSQPFVLYRGGGRVAEHEGVKGSSQRISFFGRGVEVFVGDWLEDVRARAWLRVTDVNQSKLAGQVSTQVKYETEAQEERRRAEQRASQQFTFNAPAYGVFGSQQDFTFEQVIHDLDRQIEERGGEDKEELHLMVAEIREVLETQDSISRSKFQRWSTLANKHFPWLMGPLGSLLVNYTFGVPGPG